MAFYYDEALLRLIKFVKNCGPDKQTKEAVKKPGFLKKPGF